MNAMRRCGGEDARTRCCASWKRIRERSGDGRNNYKREGGWCELIEVNGGKDRRSGALRGGEC